jgi:hypothetical protein
VSRGRKNRKTQAREHESLREKVVLLFGESDNDRRAIKELAEGLRPELRGHVKPRPRLVLVKGATPEKLGKRKTDLSTQVTVER